MTRKRRRNIFRLFTALIVVIFLYVAYWSARRFDLFNDNDVTFIRYPAFGIDMPAEFSIHGIDVSHHQKKINWTLVKQMQVSDIRLQFSFIKATEGIGMVDDMFRRNWRKSKECGMIRGAYHFLVPYKSGKAQAQNFIETVDLEKGDLPPVLDVESLSGTTVAELKRNTKEWLETVELAYKIKPIIYSGVDFYSRYLGDEFNSYPLWAAHYQQKSQPKIKRQWNIWQHNESGHVNGIATMVDFNAFNGDSIAFRKLLIQ